MNVKNQNSNSELEELYADLESALNQVGERFNTRRRWNLWGDSLVEATYPEMKEYFDRIGQSLGVNDISLMLTQVKDVFPDDMPEGSWPKDYDYENDPENRLGAYAGFQKDGITLIIHGFYKAPRETAGEICWRARVISSKRDEIIYMPKRKDHDGSLKTHQWCENFLDHFLKRDLPFMLR